MFLHRLVIGILALLLPCIPADACKSDIAEVSHREGELSPWIARYDSAFAKAQKKIVKAYPQYSGIRVVNNEHSNFDYAIKVMAIPVDGKPFLLLGKMDFSINGNQLFASVDVLEPVRRMGLNTLMRLHTLMSHPQITEIKAELLDLNRAMFVIALTSGPEDLLPLASKYLHNDRFRHQTNDLLADEIRELQYGRNAAEFHQRAVEAIQLYTPWGRVNASTGFSHYQVIRIQLNPFQGHQSVTIEATTSFGTDKKSRSLPLVIDDNGKLTTISRSGHLRKSH